MRLSSRCATARSRGRRLHRHRGCPVTREVKTNRTVAEPKRRRDAHLAARCVRYASCQMSGGSCGNPTSNRASDSALALSKLIRRRKRAYALRYFLPRPEPSFTTRPRETRPFRRRIALSLLNPVRASSSLRDRSRLRLISSSIADSSAVSFAA